MLIEAKMWLSLLCLLSLHLVAYAQIRSSPSVAEFPRDVVKTLYVKNGGTRGSWQAPEFCPIGTYASGFRLKLERAMYAGGDDTCMNGIRMTCTRPGSLDFFGTISSESAHWGSWSRQYDCRRSSGHESFLTKFSLKVEPRRGNFRDDSAANNIKFICRPISGSKEYTIEALGGPWGSYAGWSGSCGPRSAVCGVQTKVAAPRGPGDDTGLNDVRFFCCNDQLMNRCDNRHSSREDIGLTVIPRRPTS